MRVLRYLPAWNFSMNLISTLLISFSMSADAFAVAAGKGASLRRPRPLEAFRVGAIFGLIEMITPLLGWCLGYAASSYVVAIDHWIAFIIMAFIGARMIWHSRQPEPEKARPRRHKLSALIIAGIGSSIDAMAVGVTLAFINADIIVTAIAIGLTTFVMATLGMLVGRYAGGKLGPIAELVGGLILIAIGSVILIEHLSA